MKLFIDTNVVLDFLLRRDPFYAHAARLFNAIEVDGHEAFISAISFNNVFYIARRSIGTANAKDLVRNLRKLCRTVPLNDLVMIEHSPCHPTISKTASKQHRRGW